MAIRELAIERFVQGERTAAVDRIVVEAPLQILARGVAVATVMRTPGNDDELVRGLLHAEAIAGADQATLVCEQDARGDGVAHVDLDPTLFAPRGTISTAACGVCGRAGVGDFERNAVRVAALTMVTPAVIAGLPDTLRKAQAVFDATGGLHAAGLFDLQGQLLVLREDVGRHNAVDKIVGWARAQHIDAAVHIIGVSGRLGFELVQKTIRLGSPLIAAVSAPSSLAVEVAETFGVTAVGFVRGGNFNVYSNAWRIR